MKFEKYDNECLINFYIENGLEFDENKETFGTHELEENRTIRKIRTVQKEGNREVSRKVAQYNLQMVIAIGFKVNNSNF